MSTIMRLICFFKGHDVSVTLHPETFKTEVQGTCNRCGHNLRPSEAYGIMRRVWEKEIEL